MRSSTWALAAGKRTHDVAGGEGGEGGGLLAAAGAGGRACKGEQLVTITGLVDIEKALDKLK